MSDHEPTPAEADSATTDAGATDAEARPAAKTPLWLAVVIAVVFAVLYAYDLWEAIGNLVGLNIQAGALGISLSAYGIVLLIVGIVVPALVYGAAFWLARLRGPLAQLAIFFTGWCTVQAVSLTIGTLFGAGGLDFG
ncbi:hypothetical protein [Agromyces archimandritae]|uniref:Uncharacterized protein n=1 Tax=Agromyces archimandritae TaxID=2781962 RepID=A0A975FMC0_9MICO|nr:hypothetical protein [Agromyces archimandritae]QTX04352.1 hypothetical protein G127AT_13910 [Agromyces archimandritae]